MKTHIAVTLERISHLRIFDDKLLVIEHFFVVAFVHNVRINQLQAVVFLQAVGDGLYRGDMTHTGLEVSQQNFFRHITSLQLQYVLIRKVNCKGAEFCKL